MEIIIFGTRFCFIKYFIHSLYKGLNYKPLLRCSINLNQMKKRFIPLCDIPCFKVQTFGILLGTLFEGIDYEADNFVQSTGMTFFTLNDEEGWIGDYVVQTIDFLVEEE